MDWIAQLTDINLPTLYDVTLDLRDGAQMIDEPVIALVPNVVKFRALLPQDGVNMRDRYGELRWQASAHSLVGPLSLRQAEVFCRRVEGSLSVLPAAAGV